MPTIEINGKTLEVKPGQMIIEVADAAGIYIPRFCYHEKLSIAANCRMCLVEVEKAPKPLPACATPVADGMKVFTASKLAVEAQKGTMEFLLINHPLDCPVCDQGGECPLQDQALGYGKDISRFTEKKRVVEDKDIGPLIETEMTRCIHCTRCVRFGQEVAGVMELGMTGRGEHSEIATFLGSVDSELSGNMVDLCPVGALTNKPYRFTARSWELVDHDGISPHDCVGANTNIQSIRGKVKRILPRDNEAVNQCWLSDRDRYSFDALNSPERLTRPMIRRDGQWQAADWETALNHAVSGLRSVINQQGADQIGALAAPTSTLEEFYLLQKLMRSVGSNNVDHRLRQQDFRDDDASGMRPWLGCRIEDLEKARTILLVGSNIRKDQPLLGLRVRNASLGGAKVMSINPMDYDFNFDVAQKIIAAPDELPGRLASVVRAAYGGSGEPDDVSTWVSSDRDTEATTGIAAQLTEAGQDAVIILGSGAASNADASVLRSMVQALAEKTGARWGSVVEGNGAAAWVAGCVPHRSAHSKPDAIAAEPGLSAGNMIHSPRKGYLLLNVEPALDCADAKAAADAMRAADFSVALSVFDLRDSVEVDVLLPVTPYSETSGSYVNCEGLLQSTPGAVPPPGEARPAWKVLRVLGNLFEAEGFDYITSEDVRNEIDWSTELASVASSRLQVAAPNGSRADGSSLARIADVPLYRVDALIRRAVSLQSTGDNPPAMAHLGNEEARRLGVAEGDQVDVSDPVASVLLPVHINAAVPSGSVYVPSGWEATEPLGASPFVKVSKV